MLANGDQKKSRSYLLAVEDTEFLLRDEMRSLRFAMEYGKPELLLRDWGVRSTVVVFGSARIPSPEAAQRITESAHSEDAIASGLIRKAAKDSPNNNCADFGSGDPSSRTIDGRSPEVDPGYSTKCGEATRYCACGTFCAGSRICTSIRRNLIA